MKLLTFVIPSYKETEKDVFLLLSSIAGQVGLDLSSFEIIIVRDGTQELDLSKFEILNLDIKQIVLEENGGPGVARQAGLTAAAGKYIMFCDADDTLHSVGVIGAMIQEMENQGWDILRTSWLEECFDPNQNKLIYVNHELDNTWMHGKMFRREFLQKNNISFHPELRVHEDTYFLSVAAEYTEKIGWYAITSYVWKWGENSITRHDSGIYRYDSSIEFIKACSYAHERAEIRNPEHMEYKIVQLTLYHYFSLHGADWQQPGHIEYLKPTEEAFVKYISPYWKYWQNAAPETIAKIYNEERQKSYQGQVEYETLAQWLARLGLKEVAD